MTAGAATLRRARRLGDEARGVAFCVASAAAFGAMAIFGKLAYRSDINILTLLTLRFVGAAAIFWALTPTRRAPARAVIASLALGAIGYSAQSGLFFGAIRRMDASVTALLLYAYPALVTVAAVALRRERASRRRVTALVAASAGVVLVLLGGGGGSIDAAGAAMALGAAVAYTVYILTSDTVIASTDPLLVAALVATGAAGTFTVGSTATGQLDLGFDAEGWIWLAGIVLVSTVAAIGLFFAGLRRVGPSTASILSTFEPVVTVALAFLVFGERLGAVQLLGGALVLSAIVVLQARRTARSAR